MATFASDIPGAFGVQTSSFRVPASMFAESRRRLVDAFAAAHPDTEALLLFKGGEQKTRHETDHEPLFRQESFFAHLWGVVEPGCYGVLSVPDGRATLFVPRLPQEYAVWMGAILPPEAFTTKYQVCETLFVDELCDWLLAQPAVQASGSDPNHAAVHTLYGVNSDTGASGPPLPDFDGFDAKINSTSAYLRDLAVAVRVIKSAAEIALLERVCEVASDGHLAVMRHCAPGMTEAQLESVFLHHAYYHGGCRVAPYTGICGCGPNAATLHYGHASAPNDRVLRDGEMMLVDMGCELRCYGSDVTCSFPVNGKFTPQQRFVFETVALCQARVLRSMRVGVPWADLHALAYATITERLKEHGVLQGSLEAMAAANLGYFFMPHGLGHLIGVDTHDVGGYPVSSSHAGAPAKPPQRDTRRGFASLRMQRKLAAGMCLTVEPGLYFIDHLMDEIAADPQTRGFLVEEKTTADQDEAEEKEKKKGGGTPRFVLDRFRGSGGVRLEDVVVVLPPHHPGPQAGGGASRAGSGGGGSGGGGGDGGGRLGVRNLTQCPRTVADVEAAMAGALTDKAALTPLAL